MTQQGKKLSVALIAIPSATASTIYGMYDLFSSAGRDWPALIEGSPGISSIAPAIVASDMKGFHVSNGVWIQPDYSFDTCPIPDVVCLPEVLVHPDENISGRYPDVMEWLVSCARSRATIASVCSGAMLLAEAGLLDGGEATTHWAYCDALEKRYPGVKVHRSRAVVASGPGQRIITAGGGTTVFDLALFLVARFLGQEEAMRLAKLYLLDWNKSNQLPFAALARSGQVEDQVVGKCQEWLADNYISPVPVASMAELSGLSERTFKRRFTKATGMSPIDYVHTLRLEEAKQSLETTDIAIEKIAREVGYEDGSFFRRLFRRKVGITPLEYRKRFGSIRKVLQTAQHVI